MQRDSRSAEDTKQRMQRDGYLSRKPSSGFHADELIGTTIRSRPDSDDIGTVRDLIIDENGQVVAVIVGVGGFLGMGEKDVAIGWDALQRTRNMSVDAFDYHVDESRDALRNAPAYTTD